jgi:hypothetical protein
MAVTNQLIQGENVLLKDIASDIATKMAATGKWAVVVDNFAT